MNRVNMNFTKASYFFLFSGLHFRAQYFSELEKEFGLHFLKRLFGPYYGACLEQKFN